MIVQGVQFGVELRVAVRLRRREPLLLLMLALDLPILLMSRDFFPFYRDWFVSSDLDGVCLRHLLGLNLLNLCIVALLHRGNKLLRLLVEAVLMAKVMLQSQGLRLRLPHNLSVRRSFDGLLDDLIQRCPHDVFCLLVVRLTRVDLNLRHRPALIELAQTADFLPVEADLAHVPLCLEWLRAFQVLPIASCILDERCDLSPTLSMRRLNALLGIDDQLLPRQGALQFCVRLVVGSDLLRSLGLLLGISCPLLDCIEFGP